jgi:DNA-binding NtrC family response regulator
MARILIVDDEQNMRQILTVLLQGQGYDVVSLEAGPEAIELIQKEDFDVLISDIRMQPMDGLELLEQARNLKPHMSVVMLTAYSSLETAVSSLKLGAFDYLPKPFKVPELLEVIRRAVEYSTALKNHEAVTRSEPPRYHIENVVAESPAMQAVCELVKRIGPTDSPVLIYGEDGVGKELIAHAVHNHSKRKDRDFTTINCAEVPEPVLKAQLFGYAKGAFEGAEEDTRGALESKEGNGGSVFFDEINRMPSEIQNGLADVIATRKSTRIGDKGEFTADVRILAATNSEPSGLAAEGQLDKQLFSRLGVLSIEVKPLRDRPEDILPLAKHILQKHFGDQSAEPSLSPDVVPVLQSYPWPGNVKELENVLVTALKKAPGDSVTIDSLPEKVASTPIRKDVVSELQELETARGKALKKFLKTQESDYLRKIKPNRSREG